jgi:small subunit ribosomal protein S18
MAKPQMKRGPKGKGKDAGRKFKRKVSILNSESIEYVDWKDVNLLRRFVSDRAKVRARRVTGNDVQQQRDVARAIKLAREMALIPYANRVTTQRGGRGRGRDGDGDDRRDRRDRPERSEGEASETAAGAPSEATAEFEQLEGAASVDEAVTETVGGEQ